MSHLRFSNERGVALITLFVITAILSLTGIALINSTFFEARMAVRNEHQIMAHFQARTGLQIAQYALLEDEGEALRDDVHQLFGGEGGIIYLTGALLDPEDASSLDFVLSQVGDDSASEGHIVVVMELVQDRDDYVLVEARSTADVGGQEETAILRIELNIEED